MTGFSFVLDGDHAVGLKFEHFPEQARVSIEQAMHGLVDELQARVEGSVPRLTGKLAAEIGSEVRSSEGGVIGRVFVQSDSANDIEKAWSEESGAHGGASVRPHEQLLRTAFGRYVEPMQVMVRAYSRHANITKRDFMGGPLHAMEQDAVERLREAVGRAVLE